MNNCLQTLFDASRNRNHMERLRGKFYELTLSIPTCHPSKSTQFPRKYAKISSSFRRDYIGVLQPCFNRTCLLLWRQICKQLGAGRVQESWATQRWSRDTAYIWVPWKFKRVEYATATFPEIFNELLFWSIISLWMCVQNLQFVLLVPEIITIAYPQSWGRGGRTAVGGRDRRIPFERALASSIGSP